MTDSPEIVKEAIGLDTILEEWRSLVRAILFGVALLVAVCLLTSWFMILRSDSNTKDNIARNEHTLGQLDCFSVQLSEGVAGMAQVVLLLARDEDPDVVTPVEQEQLNEAIGRLIAFVELQGTDDFCINGVETDYGTR